MANNDKDNGNGLNLGEIGMIRNILMGEQINDFEQKFNELQDKIKAVDKALNSKLDALHDDTTQKLQILDKEVKEGCAANNGLIMELDKKALDFYNANGKKVEALNEVVNNNQQVLEKQIMAQVEKLNKLVSKVSKDDKMRLGKMLDKVSKQLMGE